MKILIIDDDVDILRLTGIKLTKAGHDISTVQDGAAGADLAHSEKPSLIILETELANKHGHDIIRAVKKSHKPAPLVIILSSEDTDEAIAAGFAAGADDYMIKPFSPRVLLERMRVVAIRAQQ